MAHIHTKPGQHDFTSSAFIFRMDLAEPMLLLHKHKLLGKYLQVGGHIELNETPWQAIIREIAEESGYAIDQLKILQPKVRLTKITRSKLHPQPACINTHSFNKDHSHTDLEYAFVAYEPPRNKVGSHESHRLDLFSQSEVTKLSDDQTFANVREIALFMFEHILTNWVEVDCDKFVL